MNVQYPDSKSTKNVILKNISWMERRQKIYVVDVRPVVGSKIRCQPQTILIKKHNGLARFNVLIQRMNRYQQSMCFDNKFNAVGFWINRNIFWSSD